MVCDTAGEWVLASCACQIQPWAAAGKLIVPAWPGPDPIVTEKAAVPLETILDPPLLKPGPIVGAGLLISALASDNSGNCTDEVPPEPACEKRNVLVPSPPITACSFQQSGEMLLAAPLI